MMKGWIKLLGFAIALFLTVLMPMVVKAGGKVDLEKCTFKDKKMYGKVQIVKSFPDITVKVVESFPDLQVQTVSSFPDACGKWQFVESFPDFKIKYVESFPDLEIKFVNSFPGLP
jgi:hypothetical protein